jgi:hypothetical protein
LGDPANWRGVTIGWWNTAEVTGILIGGCILGGGGDFC